MKLGLKKKFLHMNPLYIQIKDKTFSKVNDKNFISLIHI
jgi:hypothetical protein